MERYKFNGKEKDVTGLYYYGARYYDAEVGRFVSLDEVTGDTTIPQSLNKYIYVMNNPLKYIDPTGNFVVIIFGIVITISSLDLLIAFLIAVAALVIAQLLSPDDVEIDIGENWIPDEEYPELGWAKGKYNKDEFFPEEIDAWTHIKEKHPYVRKKDILDILENPDIPEIKISGGENPVYMKEGYSRYGQYLKIIYRKEGGRYIIISAYNPKLRGSSSSPSGDGGDGGGDIVDPIPMRPERPDRPPPP